MSRDEPSTCPRASDGRAIDEIPVDERLKPQVASAAAVVVRDFVVALSSCPDGPTSPHDLAPMFHRMRESGDLTIEPTSEGLRVVPLTGNGLYHVGQFLWPKARGDTPRAS